MQWGGAHVWKVGGKVFAIGGWGPDKQPAFTFKTSVLNFDILSDQPGFRPAPYLASRGFKWIQQFDQNPGLDIQLRAYIEDSYHLVANKLSKKKRTELGITESMGPQSG